MKLDTNFKDRNSLGQDVFEYLKNAIIDQTIEPGARLVESKMAKMLGISRTPLREALHKLALGGWIERLHSGGFQVVTLTREDVEQTYGIRSVLEGYAAKLATEKFQDKDLIPLEKNIEEYDKCLASKKNWDKLQALNTQFHDLLYALSQNAKLITMVNQLRAQLPSVHQILLKQEEAVRNSNKDHIQLLQALKDRDGERVEQLLRAHIIKGKNMVLAQLAQAEKTKNTARNNQGS
jgi:DNA-binding GntR family transcriptional regulator